MKSVRPVHHILIAAGLALLVFVLQLRALPSAGMTWDEPSVFLIGRANLKFWMTGNRQYINDLHDKTLYADHPMVYMYGAEFYPPFSYVLGAAFSYVLAERMQVMPVIDAYHLAGLLLSVIGVAALYGLLVEAGIATGIAAGMTLVAATYPTLSGQMRNDAKDVPLMSLIAVSMWLFLRFLKAWQHGSDRSRILLGVASFGVLGLAASIKPTAFFMIPICVIWLGFAVNESRVYYKTLKPFRRILLLLPLMIFAAVGVFLFTWPWIWEDPIHRARYAWNFFKEVGVLMPVPHLGKMYRAGATLPAEYPLVILVLQTPVLLSLLAIAGMASAVRTFIKRHNPIPLFFVFWFWIGIARFFLDGVIIYAKIRQIIDMMPAFFVLAAYGVVAVSAWVQLRLKTLQIPARIRQSSRWVGMGLVGLLLVHHLWIIVRYFPYEPSYFNVLIGGTRGAVAAKYDVEYWGSGVAEAMEFINTKANKPVAVYACLMRHLAVNYAAPGVTITQVGEPYQYALIPNSPSWFGSGLNFFKEFYKPAYIVERDGTPLFYVYEVTSPLIWRCGNESKTTDRF